MNHGILWTITSSVEHDETMSIIVEDCAVIEHTTSGGPYDGDMVYKIRMKIDSKFYISQEDFALDKAIKFRDEWRKVAGYGQ